MYKPWYKDKKNYKEIVLLAKELINKAQKEKLVILSLGQSPAWISHVIKLCSDTTMVKKVAFSGQFYNQAKLYEDGEPTIIYYSMLSENEESEEEGDEIGRPSYENNYRLYLEQKQMSPTQIINRWKTENMQTLIVDYALTGEGIASFLSILMRWSEEMSCSDELQKALKIFLFHQYSIINQIVFLENRNFKINVEKKYCDSKLFVNLDKSEKSDRILPHYSYNEWHTSPIKPTENKELIRKISAKLKEELINNENELAHNTERKQSALLVSDNHTTISPVTSSLGFFPSNENKRESADISLTVNKTL